ncbi:MAG TPA: hypothetical protein VGG10_21535 [Rhizomicrobium sp.]|jgi:hypothetical protein
MKLLLSAVALCCTLALAACFPPATLHPIGGTQTADPLLTGDWHAKMAESDPGQDEANFHFKRQADGSITLEIDAANKKDMDRMTVALTTAQVGANRFANAKLVDAGPGDDTDKGPQRGTMAFLYRQEGATVVIYQMDEDATKAAIKAGKIQGEVEPGQFGDAIITADPAALNAFVASPQGVALFSEKFATLTKTN